MRSLAASEWRGEHFRPGGVPNGHWPSFASLLLLTYATVRIVNMLSGQDGQSLCLRFQRHGNFPNDQWTADGGLEGSPLLKPKSGCPLSHSHSRRGALSIRKRGTALFRWVQRRSDRKPGSWPGLDRRGHGETGRDCRLYLQKSAQQRARRTAGRKTLRVWERAFSNSRTSRPGCDLDKST